MKSTRDYFVDSDQKIAQSEHCLSLAYFCLHPSRGILAAAMADACDEYGVSRPAYLCEMLELDSDTCQNLRLAVKRIPPTIENPEEVVVKLGEKFIAFYLAPLLIGSETDSQAELMAKVKTNLHELETLIQSLRDYIPSSANLFSPTKTKVLKCSSARQASTILNAADSSLEEKVNQLTALTQKLNGAKILKGNLMSLIHKACRLLMDQEKLSLRISTAEDQELLQTIISESENSIYFMAYHAQDWQEINPVTYPNTHPHILLLPANKNADYIMTDPHGYPEFFEYQLSLLAKNESTRLFICGDMVDRGPNSFALLQKINIAQQTYPNRIFCVRGNHEDLVLKVLVGLEKYPNLAQELKIICQDFISNKFYPFNQDQKDDLREQLGSLCENQNLSEAESVELGEFLEAVYCSIINGGDWVFDLTKREQAVVQDFIIKLPYVINVAGEFNIVHAALPSFFEIQYALEHGFNLEQINYLTWARTEDLAKDNANEVLIDIMRSRSKLVTYVGHNALGGDAKELVRVNAIDLDLDTYNKSMMLVLNHTKKTGVVYYRDNKKFSAIERQLENIQRNIITVWQKLNPKEDIKKAFDNISLTSISPIYNSPFKSIFSRRKKTNSPDHISAVPKLTSVFGKW